MRHDLFWAPVLSYERFVQVQASCGRVGKGWRNIAPLSQRLRSCFSGSRPDALELAHQFWGILIPLFEQVGRLWWVSPIPPD